MSIICLIHDLIQTFVDHFTCCCRIQCSRRKKGLRLRQRMLGSGIVNTGERIVLVAQATVVVTSIHHYIPTCPSLYFLPMLLLSAISHPLLLPLSFLEAKQPQKGWECRLDEVCIYFVIYISFYFRN